MNLLLVGGDAEAQAENLNALRIAFGEETGLKSVASLGAARRELQNCQYQIVLDLGLPKETRWRLLRLLTRQLDPLVQVIVVFDSEEEDLVADALRQGASEVVVRSHTYLALLPLIVERAYQHHLLLAQRRPASRHAFDLETLGQLTKAVTQAMDLGKAMDQARTALREVDVLLEKGREELVKRRAILRQAGSECNGANEG
jgi:DNA-binding NarL/FixJ family response regulator